MADWCEENHVDLAFIQPGKPQQNGFVERFNGSFRREFLDAYLLESLDLVFNVRQRQSTKQRDDKLWPMSRPTAYRLVKRVMNRAGIEGP